MRQRFMYDCGSYSGEERKVDGFWRDSIKWRTSVDDPPEVILCWQDSSREDDMDQWETKRVSDGDGWVMARSSSLLTNGVKSLRCIMYFQIRFRSVSGIDSNNRVQSVWVEASTG